MAFVTKVFEESAGDDNKLSLIEFICVLPELIKSLKTAPTTPNDDDDISPNTIRHEVHEKLANKLTKNFDEIDVDQSGTVTVDEMW